MKRTLLLYRRRFLQELLRPDREEAAAILDQAVGQGLSAERIYCDILGAAQAELGQMRHAAQISAADEHLATSIIDEQCVRLRDRLLPLRQHKKRVVVSTFPGDQHSIGAKIVANLFIHDGWQVDFLAQGLPADDLINFIKARNTDLLAFSLTVSAVCGDAMNVIKKIRFACPDLPVMVGGTLVRESANAFEQLGVQVCSESAIESVRRAARLVGLKEPVASLEQILHGMGSRIRTLRKRKKMNQLDLGQVSGLDRAYISSIEQGKKNITIGSAYRIACALGVNIDDLISLS